MFNYKKKSYLLILGHTNTQTSILQQVHSKVQTAQNKTFWFSYFPGIESLPGNTKH